MTMAEKKNTNTTKKKETVEEYLARGGKITICPPFKGPLHPITARPKKVV